MRDRLTDSVLVMLTHLKSYVSTKMEAIFLPISWLFDRRFPKFTTGFASFYQLVLKTRLISIASKPIIIVVVVVVIDVFLLKTSPPSARVAAMRFMLRQNCKTKLHWTLWNTLGVFFWNFLETHMTLPLNT